MSDLITRKPTALMVELLRKGAASERGTMALLDHNDRTQDGILRRDMGDVRREDGATHSWLVINDRGRAYLAKLDGAQQQAVVEPVSAPEAAEERPAVAAALRGLTSVMRRELASAGRCAYAVDASEVRLSSRLSLAQERALITRGLAVKQGARLVATELGTAVAEELAGVPVMRAAEAALTAALDALTDAETPEGRAVAFEAAGRALEAADESGALNTMPEHVRYRLERYGKAAARGAAIVERVAVAVAEEWRETRARRAGEQQAAEETPQTAQERPAAPRAAVETPEGSGGAEGGVWAVGDRAAGVVKGQAYTGRVVNIHYRGEVQDVVHVATDGPLVTPAGRSVSGVMLRGAAEIATLRPESPQERPAALRAAMETPEGPEDVRAAVVARLDAVWSAGYVTGPPMTQDQRRVAAEVVADYYTDGGTKLLHGVRDRDALVQEYRSDLKSTWDLMNAYGHARLVTGGDVWALVARNRTGERAEALRPVVEAAMSEAGEVAVWSSSAVVRGEERAGAGVVAPVAVAVLLAQELSDGSTVHRHARGALRVTRGDGAVIMLRPAAGERRYDCCGCRACQSGRGSCVKVPTGQAWGVRRPNGKVSGVMGSHGEALRYARRVPGGGTPVMVEPLGV